MDIIVGLVVSVAISVAVALLRKGKGPQIPKEAPTTLANRGEFIPLVVGRQRITPLHCVSFERDVKKIKGGQGIFSNGVTEIRWKEGGWHVLCVGPVTALHRIYKNGDPVFDQTITPDDTPAGSQLSTRNGVDNFRIYWGMPNQPVDPALVQFLPGNPKSQWPRICYVVWQHARLGPTAQWPEYEYEVEVQPYGSPLDPTDEAWMGESSPGFKNDGANPAHVLWQVMTGPYPYGVNLPSQYLDAPQFTKLANQFSHEHVPMHATARGDECGEFIAALMECWGFVMPQVGKLLHPRLVRKADPASSAVIIDDVLSTDPERTKSYDQDTVDNITYVYPNRRRQYRPEPVQWPNDAIALPRRRPNVKTIQLPYVTDNHTASRIANRRRLETVVGDELLKIDVARDARQLMPGQMFIVPDVGQVRCVAVHYNFKSSLAQVDAIMDQYGNEPGAYVAPDDEDTTSGNDEAPQPDVAVKPLFIDGSSPPAIVVFRARASERIVSAGAYVSWNGVAYSHLGDQDVAASGGALNSPIDAADASPIDVGPTITAYSSDVDDALDLSADDDAWTDGDQLCVIDDEVFYLKRVEKVSGGYRLRGLIRAQMSSVAGDHAINAAVLISARGDLTQLQSNRFTTGANITVKTAPQTAAQSIQLDLVSPVAYTIP